MDETTLWSCNINCGHFETSSSTYNQHFTKTDWYPTTLSQTTCFSRAHRLLNLSVGVKKLNTIVILTKLCRNKNNKDGNSIDFCLSINGTIQHHEEQTVNQNNYYHATKKLFSNLCQYTLTPK
jgi:hypothetical protein